jgi:preprotein translocase subunit SecA
MDADQAQRIAEGQNLDIRLFLRKYESVIEGQRQMIAERRQEALLHPESFPAPAEQRALLETLDELWSDYLAAVAEVRSGTAWISLGYANPLRQYISQIHRMFIEMEGSIDDEVAARLASDETDEAAEAAPRQRGATWTYITTDQPFGPAGERVMRGLVRMVRRLRT